MKVLHYVSIMNRAGQETFIMNMYRQINRKRIQFGFLCTVQKKGDYDEEIYSLGGKIHYIQLNKENSKLKFMHNFLELRKVLKKLSREYQAFHIHTYHAFDAFMSVIAAKLAGIDKVIVHSHNTNATEHLMAHKICCMILNIMPIKRLACANLAGKWMYGSDKFQVINNAIDTNQFRFNDSIRKEYREQLGLQDKFVVGHVGRFEEQKNHLYLIKIFAEYVKINENAILLLIGKGSLEQSVRDLVKELDIVEYVRFLGTRNDVSELYQAMDLFLLPSKYEGLPVVLVEAQMASLPCMITDNITKEIDVTDKVYRCSVNSIPLKWAETIEYCRKQEHTRKDETENISNNGFELGREAKKLSKIYLN